MSDKKEQTQHDEEAEVSAEASQDDTSTEATPSNESPDTNETTNDSDTSDGSSAQEAETDEIEDEFAFPEAAEESEEDEEDDDIGLTREELERLEMWGADPDPVVPIKWRPLIPLTMGILSFFLLSLFVDELKFVFADPKPVDVGSVMQGCPKDFYKKLKPNTVVKIRDILPQLELSTEVRIQFERRNYVVALGCDLIISLPKDVYKKLFMEKEKSEKALDFENKMKTLTGGTRKRTKKKRSYAVFRPFTAVGRVVRAFDSGHLQPVRQFYKRNGVEFSKDAFALYVGDMPGKMWWWIPLYILFGLFALYNLWLFVKLAWEALLLVGKE